MKLTYSPHSVGFGMLLLGGITAVFAGPAKQPNILLILTDDQGWGDLACHGNKQLETPVLDLLSRSGASFERFYVSPLSAPTRASLLTGRYHLRTGVSGVSNREEVLGLDETTIAQVFKTAGYATGCFGKWHNGEQFPYTPNAKGFNEFFGFCGGHLNNYFDADLQHNALTEKSQGYITDVLTNKAIDFISNNKERPFFCYLPFNAPHAPFQVPDAYFNKYKNKGLNDTTACVYGMVENIDFNIGRLLARLDSLDLTEQTIVVFLSDNGPNTVRYNGNMRGIKGFVDQGGVRVPCFIKYPGVIQSHTTLHSPAAHIDLLPTLAEFCGLKLSDSIPLDGKSLVSLLKAPANDTLNRLIFAQNKLRNPSLSVRDNHYILVQGKENNKLLYDLRTDSAQRFNIAAGHPDLVQFYSDSIKSWYAAVTKDGLATPPILLGLDYNFPITLSAHEASIGGHLRYFEGHGWANDWVTNWGTTEDVVGWKLDVKVATSYRVKLHYSCPPTEIGSQILLLLPHDSLQVRLKTPFVSEIIPSPDRIKRKEAYPCTWGEMEMGVITFPKGKYTLQLKAALIPHHFVMDFKGIILEKIIN